MVLSMGHTWPRLFAVLLTSIAALVASSPAAPPNECMVPDPLLIAIWLDSAICQAPLKSTESPLSTSGDGDSHAPWAYPPFCIKDSGGVEKYCLYTSTEFNNAAGISFIIRPRTLPSILPYVKDTNLTSRGRPYLSRGGKSPSSQVAYVVKELEGKGLGVLARRPVSRGETFIVGFPAIIIDSGLEIGPDPEISEDDRLLIHKTAFERLPDKKRAQTLAASTGGDVYEDIMKTNGFTIRLGGHRHSGLVPETARLNHACAPNAVIRFMSKSLTMEAVAVKDVAEGEELTISYIPTDLPTEIRSGMLEGIYNFNCTCSLCTAPSGERELSDRQRNQIIAIRQVLVDPETTLVKALDLATELLALAQKEGLDIKLKDYYNELMRVFFKLKDVDSALEFAEAALEKAEEFGGGDDEFKVAIRSNVAALRKRRSETAEAEAKAGTET